MFKALRNYTLLMCFIMLFVFADSRVARAATVTQTITISLNSQNQVVLTPNPNAGLVRLIGDADTWVFALNLAPNLQYVGNVTWNWTGMNGADQAWGDWTPAANQLSWWNNSESQGFNVTASGSFSVKPPPGGNGGPAGPPPTVYSFTATWSGNVEGYQILVNNTATADDDVVHLTGNYTPLYTSVPCQVTAAATVDPTNVTLTNPDGRLNFNGATELNLTIPAAGTPQGFTLTGVNPSLTGGDATIVMTNSDTGDTLSTQSVTVYAFDSPHMNLTAGGAYGLVTETPTTIPHGAGAPPYPNGNYTVFTETAPPAMNMVAQTTLLPANVNTNAPQISNWQMGIVQNVLAYSHVTTHDTPVGWIWGDSASVPAVGGTYPVNATATVAGSYTAGIDSPLQLPLFYQTPSSLVGGLNQCSASDTPQTALGILVYPGIDGKVVVYCVYQRTLTATYDDVYEDWNVIQDKLGTVVQLRQNVWFDNVTTAPDGNLLPTTAGADVASTPGIVLTPAVPDLVNTPTGDLVNIARNN